MRAIQERGKTHMARKDLWKGYCHIFLVMGKGAGRRRCAFFFRGCPPAFRASFAALLFFALSHLPAVATGVPRIVHFSKQQYNAQNQNWSVCQAPDGRMFFGNSSGLLRYDGAHWQAFSLPGGSIVRAVACDAQGQVFVGGYARAGYWAPNEKGVFTYHSILDGVKNENARREEIWHFLPTSQGVFFQSFSTLYRFKDGKTEVITPPGNTMFIREVNGRILVPVIHEGLYEYLPDGRFVFLPGSEVLAGKRVATILPLDGSSILVATQDDGLYRYVPGALHAWEAAINENFSSVQVNKGIRLSNGNFAIGTILDGIYIISPEGDLIFHINQENGLQNNTVLALYEDQANNLWAGLDKGIDLLVTSSSLSFFTDKKGEFGTVFAAALFKGGLYIGTNQGVFYKQWPVQDGSNFRLVPGTQGQAWELKAIDGQLFCAHNTGLLLLDKDEVEPVYSSTGVYHILEAPSRKGHLILAVYIGLAVVKQGQDGAWSYSHSIDGFPVSAKDAFFDFSGRLWIAHPHQGVYCLRLNQELTGVARLPVPRVNGYPPMEELRADITYWDGKAYVWPDSGMVAFDTRSNMLTVVLPADDSQEHREGEIWIPGRNGALFKIFPHHIEYIGDGLNAHLEVALIPENEQIVSLDDTTYLIGTEDGFVVFNSRQAEDIRELAIPEPVFSAVEIKGWQKGLEVAGGLSEPFVMKPWENDLRILFGLPFYTRRVNMRYRLKGFEEGWAPFGPIYSKEYTNLPPGNYEFQVQSALSGHIAAFSFVIEPHWYQSIWVKLIAVALVFFLGRLALKVHENRLARQKRRLEVQKERELQRQRVFSKNQMLQAEILNKSRKLADSTMELVRKNEMLIRLKKELGQLRRKKEQENPAFHLQKMIRQIDRHLSSEEDWHVFEANFNQLHNQFFTRLKEQYPELTPGDLRLAAYLKMNLTSKEIAPLLNISLRGVENKRYRLRRKMGLGPEENLTEFLMQF